MALIEKYIVTEPLPAIADPVFFFKQEYLWEPYNDPPVIKNWFERASKKLHDSWYVKCVLNKAAINFYPKYLRELILLSLIVEETLSLLNKI